MKNLIHKLNKVALDLNSSIKTSSKFISWKSLEKLDKKFADELDLLAGFNVLNIGPEPSIDFLKNESKKLERGGSDYEKIIEDIDLLKDYKTIVEDWVLDQGDKVKRLSEGFVEDVLENPESTDKQIQKDIDLIVSKYSRDIKGFYFDVMEYFVDDPTSKGMKRSEKIIERYLGGIKVKVIYDIIKKAR